MEQGLFRALIIEDEPAAAKRLENMIRASDSSITIVGKVDSVSSAVKWFREKEHPDLIFLDINLGDGICFGIFDEVEVNCPVIFTTAYDEYAIKAFKLNSVDYLLKPVKQNELDFSLQKFRKLHELKSDHLKQNLKMLIESLKTPSDNRKKRFIVNFGDKIRAVDVGDIAYFLILEKNTFLVTHTNDSYGIGYSLEQLEEMLDSTMFFRINRKYIISFGSITTMWSWTRSRVKLKLVPPPPDEIIVSTERSADFKEWLNQ